MRRSLSALVLVFLALAGCGAAGAGDFGGREEDIGAVASDEVQLKGVLMLPDTEAPAGARRWPLAILLHDLGRSRDSLFQAADALVARGVAVLLMDVRGHGRSMRVRERDLYSFIGRPHKELHRAVGDQRLLIDQLRARSDVDVQRVAILGVGFGAFIAAESAARFPEVRALVLVDPHPSTAGFKSEQDLGLFGTRPVLLVGSALPQSKAQVTALSRYGAGERTVAVSEHFATQDRVLAEDPELLGRTALWIAERLSAAKP
jgi:pimeloyl-ACP methyl ester carboxylesterase